MLEFSRWKTAAVLGLTMRDWEIRHIGSDFSRDLRSHRALAFE